MIKTFRDLEVYQEAYQLMLIIHQAVKKLPVYERNDLVSQMRRASKSCPSNIAEGWAKRFLRRYSYKIPTFRREINQSAKELENFLTSTFQPQNLTSSFQRPASNM